MNKRIALLAFAALGICPLTARAQETQQPAPPVTEPVAQGEDKAKGQNGRDRLRSTLPP